MEVVLTQQMASNAILSGLVAHLGLTPCKITPVFHNIVRLPCFHLSFVTFPLTAYLLTLVPSQSASPHPEPEASLYTTAYPAFSSTPILETSAPPTGPPPGPPTGLPAVPHPGDCHQQLPPPPELVPSQSASPHPEPEASLYTTAYPAISSTPILETSAADPASLQSTAPPGTLITPSPVHLHTAPLSSQDRPGPSGYVPPPPPPSHAPLTLSPAHSRSTTLFPHPTIPHFSSTPVSISMAPSCSSSTSLPTLSSTSYAIPLASSTPFPTLSSTTPLSFKPSARPSSSSESPPPKRHKS